MKTRINYRSESGRKYKIILNTEKGDYCSCPAWRFQNKAPKFRMCKHLRAIYRERIEEAA